MALHPETGIILGTGLSALGKEIDVKFAIPYSEIPDFPVSTVQGHPGKLLFGMLGGKPVVAMQGRFHYYEGWTMGEVVLPVRVMKFLGIQRLFVSNACGGVNPAFETGDLMILDDHICLFPNPLIGKNIDELGPRFPDMSEAYDRTLIATAQDIAAAQWHPGAAGLLRGAHRSHTGNAGRIPLRAHHRRRRGGHEHRAGGDRGTPDGHPLFRHERDHRHGCGGPHRKDHP